jgi:hypothetical protein
MLELGGSCLLSQRSASVPDLVFLAFAMGTTALLT